MPATSTRVDPRRGHHAYTITRVVLSVRGAVGMVGHCVCGFPFTGSGKDRTGAELAVRRKWIEHTKGGD